MNGHQPDANFSAPHNDQNYADYGPGAQYRDNLFRGDPWYEGLPPLASVSSYFYVYHAHPLLTSAPLKSLEGQYTHKPNPSIIGDGPTGNAEHMFAARGPRRGEHYYIPPAHVHVRNFHILHRVCLTVPTPQDVPNNGIRERPPPMPEGADPFSQNVPNPDPSRMSATEDLKRLMSRYLDNPDSQVDTFRVGLSPSGSRLRVMIMLDIDI
jgi:hypothetical protein